MERVRSTEEGRKVAALPSLRDPELQAAEPGIQRAVTEAVAVVPPLAGALVRPGADQALHIGFHQRLRKLSSQLTL